MHLPGLDAIDNERWFTLGGVLGMPMLTMDFVPVPEGKCSEVRTLVAKKEGGARPLQTSAAPWLAIVAGRSGRP